MYTFDLSPLLLCGPESWLLDVSINTWKEWRFAHKHLSGSSEWVCALHPPKTKSNIFKTPSIVIQCNMEKIGTSGHRYHHITGMQFKNSQITALSIVCFYFLSPFNGTHIIVHNHPIITNEAYACAAGANLAPAARYKVKRRKMSKRGVMCVYFLLRSGRSVLTLKQSRTAACAATVYCTTRHFFFFIFFPRCSSNVHQASNSGACGNKMNGWKYHAVDSLLEKHNPAPVPMPPPSSSTTCGLVQDTVALKKPWHFKACTSKNINHDELSTPSP